MFQFPHTRETFRLADVVEVVDVSIPAHTGNIILDEAVDELLVSIPAHTGNISNRVIDSA